MRTITNSLIQTINDFICIESKVKYNIKILRSEFIIKQIYHMEQDIYYWFIEMHSSP